MTTFSPSEIEEVTGWANDGLRDLRRKGYLESYGTLGENGRWRYELPDLVAF